VLFGRTPTLGLARHPNQLFSAPEIGSEPNTIINRLNVAPNSKAWFPTRGEILLIHVSACYCLIETAFTIAYHIHPRATGPSHKVTGPTSCSGQPYQQFDGDSDPPFPDAAPPTTFRLDTMLPAHWTAPLQHQQARVQLSRFCRGNLLDVPCSRALPPP
jgi:hypothetical protein